MNIYSKKIRWKFILLLLAIAIGVGSLYYTSVLVEKLADEERKKVEIWAEATAWLSGSNNENDAIVDVLFKLLENRDVVELMIKTLNEKKEMEIKNVEDSIFVANINHYKTLIRNRQKRTKILNSIKEKNSVIDGFMVNIITENITVPLVVTNEREDSIRFMRNLRNIKKLENPEYAIRWLKTIKEDWKVIEINIPGSFTQRLYYDDSILLTKLKYFPYIQLGVILLFILVAYLAFNASRNAEQNQVWVGLSKETAHQLGTPTSSLMAWVEILKSKDIEGNTIGELEKDVYRLKKITDRFSKIGSRPKLKSENMIGILNNALEYIKTRSSNKVIISLKASEKELFVPLNVELFEWVIENICKNAIDAMEGAGKISVQVVDNMQVVYIDISDTGKGVPKSKFKTIFKPGFTTKERGWGLGLSLSKRIIENYHDGKIFVHFSELGKGSRFRIVLKKFY